MDYRSIWGICGQDKVSLTHEYLRQGDKVGKCGQGDGQ